MRFPKLSPISHSETLANAWNGAFRSNRGSCVSKPGRVLVSLVTKVNCFASNSFDVRGRPVALGRHWWDERRFERRAHFLPPSPGRVSRLQIANVSVSDAGQYRCRVDYRNAPTRNFKYRLIVVGEWRHICFSPAASLCLHITNQR